MIATFAPEPNRWIIVAFLAAPLSVPLAHVEMLVELVPNSRDRHIALFLLLFLPAFSFASGRDDAFRVKTGASEQFVDVARSKLALVSDIRNPVAYLGLLGDVYILREADRSNRPGQTARRLTSILITEAARRIALLWQAKSTPMSDLSLNEYQLA